MVCLGKVLTVIRRERPRRNPLAGLLYTQTGIPPTPAEVVAHHLTALTMAREDDLGVRAARRVVGDGLAEVGDPCLGGLAVVVEHGRVLDIGPRAVPVLADRLGRGQLPARVGLVGSADEEDVDRGTGQGRAERGEGAWYHNREQQKSCATHHV